MLTLLGRSVLAIGFSAGAFILMSYLISPSEMPPEPTDEETQISIVRKKRPENPLIKNNELPPPPQVQNSPPPVLAKLAPNSSLKNTDFNILRPIKNAGDAINLSVVGDRRAIAMVTIPPEYPQGPLSKNIEGWVLLEFTIGIDGSVDDIVVVDAEPKGSFEKAAIRAMRRWKYQPKMVDGRPVSQYHMREVFRFEIEK